jgi:hypothetical protein
LDQAWRRHEAVSRAVSVTDPQPGRNSSVDAQPTAVQRAVMRAAQHDQIVRIIATTLRAQVQMVKIDVSCIAAPRNDAAASISPEDFATNRGRRPLCGALPLDSGRTPARSTPALRVHPRKLVGGTRMSVRELVGVAHVGETFRRLVAGVGQRICEFVGVAFVGQTFRKLVVAHVGQLICQLVGVAHVGRTSLEIVVARAGMDFRELVGIRSVIV